ncbi:condensation domain-containing protein [Nocardia cyriacigeorgica]|uniref:condensation domain-containing protein n=1 Tax=Nocardia cyriacigeorgica TaxID=135487 RepID=UPI000CE9E991|nr:condensation domain-containing protein [Nocardia cyriacigeorgica]AVH23318.1 condensation protein [Nocardia cyriacigeorgica]MBF6322866.1 condensation protein [Nocardia cyriacigeorgica]PPJ10253.1 condensation protein [Nocardia cyriacigeorgica]
MRLLFLDQFPAAPGTLLEWVAGADAALAEHIPATSNQTIHLSGSGPTSWLAGTFEVPGPVDADAMEAAFARWLPRHDALHCYFDRTDGARPVATRLVPDNDIRLTPRPPVAADSTPELRELLASRLDEACEPFGFAPYFLGAISRDDISTVIIGFDHAVCDAWSIAIAVVELDVLYRAAQEGDLDTVARDLPQPGSFLTYATRESACTRAGVWPLVAAWQEFLAASGHDLPHFPLDLGLTAGERAPFQGEVRTILDAIDVDRLHRRARVEGYSLFAAMLAALARTVAELGGPEVTDLVFPMHTRHEPRHHSTVGWLVSNAPARIPVRADFTSTARAADAAIRAGRRLARVPAIHVLDELGERLRRTRQDLFSVSYTDYRYLPGGSRSDLPQAGPRNPAQISRALPLDDVQMWFTRTDDGLGLRIRYPGTPTARRLLPRFLDRLAAILNEATRSLEPALH